jgi:triosephosphate isomerase (TIM)
MSDLKPLIAGNWKMNGLHDQLKELLTVIKAFAHELDAETHVALCLPATLIYSGAEIAKGSSLKIGGQDCHMNDNGAHTGDVSAPMLKDAGAQYVIVGHSERRTDHHESNDSVRQKAQAAQKAGLIAIICIGETEAERKSGATLSILTQQLAGSLPDEATSQNTVIAYEPVWAIGTGLTPTAGDILEAHNHIRSEIIKRFQQDANNIKLLYGGSVKPSNAVELLSITNVNGALVGGASLKSSDFLAICEAYQKM